MGKTLKSLFFFLGAFGSSVAIGWWLSKRQPQSRPSFPHAPQPFMPAADSSPVVRVMSEIVLPPEAFENIDEKTITPPASEHSETDSTAKAASQPALAQIKGIGPKTLEALTAIGIHNVSDLAAAEAEDIKNRLNNSRISLNQIEQWILAAKETNA